MTRRPTPPEILPPPPARPRNLLHRLVRALPALKLAIVLLVLYAIGWPRLVDGLLSAVQDVQGALSINAPASIHPGDRNGLNPR